MGKVKAKIAMKKKIQNDFGGEVCGTPRHKTKQKGTLSKLEIHILTILREENRLIK